MAAIVRAEPDRLVRAGLPLADGVEVHCHFVTTARFIESEQMAAMAQHADERAILEGARRIAWADKRRVDRNRMRETAVDSATGAALNGKDPGLNKAVAVAGAAVVEIDGVDHPVAIHRIGVKKRLEKRVWTVAHVSAAQIGRDASRDDSQVVRIGFAADRQIIAAEMRILRSPSDVRRLNRLSWRRATHSQRRRRGAGQQLGRKLSAREMVEHRCLLPSRRALRHHSVGQSKRLRKAHDESVDVTVSILEECARKENHEAGHNQRSLAGTNEMIVYYLQADIAGTF